MMADLHATIWRGGGQSSIGLGGTEVGKVERISLVQYGSSL